MIKLRKKQKGFTLVELLIVIAIIAVLAAVVTPVALNAITNSRVSAVVANVKSIQTADLAYYVGETKLAKDLPELQNYLAGTPKSEFATYALAGEVTPRTITVTITDPKVLAKITTVDFNNTSNAEYTLKVIIQ